MRAGYVPTAASLPLAQAFLLLLWLVMGAFPAWAQTGASLSGMVTNQTGAALPDVAVTIKTVHTDETRTGISLAAGQDTTVDIKMQQSTPDACTSGHEFATTDCALTWHGITLYGAYDVGVGWVSHGLPENGYNYEG